MAMRSHRFTPRTRNWVSGHCRRGLSVGRFHPECFKSHRHSRTVRASAL